MPARIQAASFTRKSKLPFKAMSIRELLLHRTSQLTSAAEYLFEVNKVVPAVILTRSIVETFAVLFAFHERLDRFLNAENRDSKALDEYLMSCLMGGRDNSDLPKAINILNSIDRVEKSVPNFRSAYDALCEFAHPNWAGTFGSFGKVMKETIELELGPNENTSAHSHGLFVLSTSLMLFEHYYKGSGEQVRLLNEYFEMN